MNIESERRAMLLQSLLNEAEDLKKRISIVRMSDEGLTVVVMAERLGVSISYVAKRLKEYGLKWRRDRVFLKNDARRGKAADRAD